MQQRSMGRVFVPMMVALGLGLMASVAALAAPAAPAPIVGVIDNAKVHSDYKAWKAAQVRMDALGREKQGIYDDLEKGKGLSEADFKEYQKLAGDVVKINPVRIKELQDLSKKNTDELADLNAKFDELTGLKSRADDKSKPLTDAEKARVDALTKELTAEKKARMEKLDADSKATANLVNEAGNKLYEQLQDEGNRLSKLLEDLTNKGIGKVATDKKLAIVVAKDVQVGENQTEKFVLWGGTEITDDVIKSLNDGFKDSMLDAPNG